MKIKQLKHLGVILSMLTAMLIFTSCKLGNAINTVDDACPIVLTDGITLTKAESGDSGMSVVLYVSINTTFIEVPNSNDYEGWNDVGQALIALLNLNPNCLELLSEARKQHYSVTINISSTNGNSLYTYTILNKLNNPNSIQ